MPEWEVEEMEGRVLGSSRMWKAFNASLISVSDGVVAGSQRVGKAFSLQSGGFHFRES